MIGQEWRCKIPAVKIDIRLEAAGFAPLYLWEFQPAILDPRDLGEWDLVPGASLSGWILSSNGGALESPVVEMTPDALQRPLERVNGEGKASEVVHPSARGFFQFSAVRVGTYSVTGKAIGLSARRISGLIVSEPREYLLPKPLSLDPLASLTLLLSPGTSFQGNPWTVRLERPGAKSNFTNRLAEQNASLTGEVQFSGLEAGDYQVVVLDESRGRQATRAVHLEPSGSSLAIDLSLVELHGKVSAGKESLKAELVFDSLDGSKVTMQTDEDGRFSGALAREGRWRVEIRPDVSGAGRLVRTVQIKRPPGSETAELDIEIPGGRLEGIVVDEHGRGVKAAVQVFRGKSLFCHMLTDEDGTFHVFGVEEGELLLRAAGDGRKGYIEHEVSSGTTLERVEIVVSRQANLKGRIVNVSGDRVPGVLIRYRGAHVGVGGETVSSPSGRFEIRDLEADQPIDIALVAPGYPVRLVQFSPWPAGDESVRLEVGRPGGLLVLDVTKYPRPPFIAGPGSLLSVFSLLPPWEGNAPPGYDVQTSTLTVHLETGRYALCPEAVPSAACRIFFVRTGMEVRLPGVSEEHSEVQENR